MNNSDRDVKRAKLVGLSGAIVLYYVASGEIDTQNNPAFSFVTIHNIFALKISVLVIYLYYIFRFYLSEPKSIKDGFLNNLQGSITKSRLCYKLLNNRLYPYLESLNLADISVWDGNISEPQAKDLDNLNNCTVTLDLASFNIRTNEVKSIIKKDSGSVKGRIIYTPTMWVGIILYFIGLLKMIFNREYFWNDLFPYLISLAGLIFIFINEL